MDEYLVSVDRFEDSLRWERSGGDSEEGRQTASDVRARRALRRVRKNAPPVLIDDHGGLLALDAEEQRSAW